MGAASSPRTQRIQRSPPNKSLRASRFANTHSRETDLKTAPAVEKISFTGAQGDRLAARLERPAGEMYATALFAHCFTCSKDIVAAREIAAQLARDGLAVLRFDFTGLGHSQGEFANTNFSSNCGDLLAAAQWMRANLEAPSLLVGHSLGGAAVLSVAKQMPEAKAVAVVAAPADAEHVTRAFAAQIAEIETRGAAEVSLAGRCFTITKQLLDDLAGQNLLKSVAALNKPLLTLHAAGDEVVDIENASALFMAAKHPRSFVSLADADHLLTRAEDAVYAARVIAAWASRYIAR